MVVISILPHGELGLDDHREDDPTLVSEYQSFELDCQLWQGELEKTRREETSIEHIPRRTNQNQIKSFSERVEHKYSV